MYYLHALKRWTIIDIILHKRDWLCVHAADEETVNRRNMCQENEGISTRGKKDVLRVMPHFILYFVWDNILDCFDIEN